VPAPAAFPLTNVNYGNMTETEGKLRETDQALDNAHSSSFDRTKRLIMHTARRWTVGTKASLHPAALHCSSRAARQLLAAPKLAS